VSVCISSNVVTNEQSASASDSASWSYNYIFDMKIWADCRDLNTLCAVHAVVRTTRQNYAGNLCSLTN
jgi:hypothetical protein